MPTVSFFRSLISAPIFPWVIKFRKRLISKMLAEVTASMIKNGINIVRGEVRGLSNAMTSKTRGTGI